MVAFLTHPCELLGAALPAEALTDSLVLSGDRALRPRTGDEYPLDLDLVHSLARRIRAYAGGNLAAAGLETPGHVRWATFAPPLVATVTLVRLPLQRSRAEAAPPRLVLGQATVPGTSPHPGLSLLISDRAEPTARDGYTLRVVARTAALLSAALDVGRHVADATFVEATNLLDWPLLARHHRAEVYTGCATLDHALVALAPPELHPLLRKLLATPEQ